jgi:uncharacterized membrane protein
MSSPSKARHFVKSISYRIYSSCITFCISYFATGSAKVGMSIGIADFFVKIGSYYVHERVWYRIKFGLKKR